MVCLRGVLNCDTSAPKVVNFCFIYIGFDCLGVQVVFTVLFCLN